MFGFVKKILEPTPAATPSATETVESLKPPDVPALSVEDYSPEVVDQMAMDMTDREGVWWAGESAKMVEDKLSPEEVKAAQAAEAWAKAPNEANAAAVDEALENVDHKGPGSWAAQAAQWAAAGGAMAGSGGAAAAAAGAGSAAGAAMATGAAPLVSHAVAGAVKMAAAVAADSMPELPDEPSPPDAPNLDDLSEPPERPDEPELSDDLDVSTPGDIDEVDEAETAAKADAKDDADSTHEADRDADDSEPTEEEKQKTAAALKPFIDRGREIQGQ